MGVESHKNIAGEEHTDIKLSFIWWLQRGDDQYAIKWVLDTDAGLMQLLKLQKGNVQYCVEVGLELLND